MKYIFSKVFKMLKWNKWISAILIIELIVGMSVFTYALNLSFSLKKREAENKKLKYDVTLQAMTKDGVAARNNIFEAEDYNQIQKFADEKAFVYIAIPQIIPYENEIIEYTVLLMDYKIMDLQDGYFYYGRTTYNQVDNINFSFPMLEKHRISDSLDVKQLRTEDQIIKYADSVIVPMNYMDEADFENEITSGALHIELNSREYNEISQVSEDIVSYMSQKYGDEHSFAMSSPQIDLQNNARGVKISIETLNKAGTLIMLIFFVGVVSIFQLLMTQREKGYGVCVACGATAKQISLEMGVEILFLCMVGSVAGCILGFIATYYLDMGIMISVVKVTGHIETVVCCILLGLCIAFFASLPLAIKICKKETHLLLG